MRVDIRKLGCQFTHPSCLENTHVDLEIMGENFTLTRYLMILRN